MRCVIQRTIYVTTTHLQRKINIDTKTKTIESISILYIKKVTFFNSFELTFPLFKNALNFQYK